MKPVTEWDEEYIRQLPRGEFDWLEFKGRRGLDFSLQAINESKVLENLSVQVSAMANSGGGTIVYGMTDPTDLSERKIDDGGVALDLKGRNTKEWLEDVIPHLVEFPLRRFSVLALTRGSGAPNAEEGRGIIVIDIEDSPEAPHQARDSKYYIRVGGKGKPAGHRIVSDIFNRGTHAEFKLEFLLYSKTRIPSDPIAMPAMFGNERKPRRSVYLEVTARNTGTVFAQFVSFYVAIPWRFVSSDDQNEDAATVIEGNRYIEFEENNQRRDVVGHAMGYANYGSSWFDPILPGLSRTWKFSLHPALTPDHIKGEILHWSIHADSARSTDGKTALAGLKFDVRDTHKIT